MRTYLQRMKQALILTGILLLLGCSEPNKQASTKSVSLPIQGKWFAASPDASYVSLDFANLTVVFDNKADTIMRFNYSINYATREIEFIDQLNRKESAKILKLNSDSLIFDRLWALNTIQRFCRVRPKR